MIPRPGLAFAMHQLLVSPIQSPHGRLTRRLWFQLALVVRVIGEMVTGELLLPLLVSPQLTGLALLRLGIPLEATMDRRDGPTNFQLAGKGATMEAPQDTMLPFHGGTVFLPGMAGGKTAGIDIFRPSFVGDEFACIYRMRMV